MDELAERARAWTRSSCASATSPTVDPDTGKPFSSRNLVGCLREGAERFGWTGRDPRPGRARRGRLAGRHRASRRRCTRQCGCPSPPRRSASTATGTSPRSARPTSAPGPGRRCRRSRPTRSACRSTHVEVRIGDTDQPVASVAGGSSGTATWGSAVVAAARAFRDKFGDGPARRRRGRPAPSENRRRGPLRDVRLRRAVRRGARHADTGEVRVPRLLGVFAAGRIINPRTARSQFIGGMTMGLSMALHENSVLDPRSGHVVNHDFAEYHIAANADVDDVAGALARRARPARQRDGVARASARSASSARRRPWPTPCTTPPASACATCRSRWTRCCPDSPERGNGLASWRGRRNVAPRHRPAVRGRAAPG